MGGTVGSDGNKQIVTKWAGAILGRPTARAAIARPHMRRMAVGVAFRHQMASVGLCHDEPVVTLDTGDLARGSKAPLVVPRAGEKGVSQAISAIESAIAAITKHDSIARSASP